MSDSESDDEFEFDPSHNDLDVELGFAERVDPDDRQHLASYYFPLGKIGGQPEWLAYKPLPKSEMLKCKVCCQPMCFLMQLYAPLTEGEHNFHRYLYVFVCRQPKCCQTNSSDHLVVLRCQLPRDNEFYPPDAVPSFDDEPDFVPNKKISDYTELCAVCGCAGEKRCAKCKSVTYCSKEHQVLHWNVEHKKRCSDQSASQSASSFSFPLDTNPWLFPEHELMSGVDYYGPGNYKVDGSTKGKMESSEQDQMAEYRKVLQKQLANKTENIDEPDIQMELDDIDEDLMVKQDKCFKRFQSALKSHPHQVVRYNRGGQPLYAADPTETTQIPPCNRCGCNRQFEYQIMPYCLQLMGVDSIEHSIDWATLLIYTCEKSCRPEDDGYVEEVVVKQDYMA